MGDARRSFTAFRLTREEREQIRKNDRDWVLDPETGELFDPKPIEDPEESKTRTRPFRMPTQIID